jgi:DNA-binding NarL/FixJ family response regulator
MAAKIRIIIADTQYIAREGLKSILLPIDDFAIVAETASNPEVVIIDYNNEGNYQVSDIAEIKKLSPLTNVLVVSSDHNRDNIFRVLDYGVKNFLTKECDREEIIEAIRATAKGEKFLCHKIIDLILEKHINKNNSDCDAANLSDRENEIITLVARGLTNKEIANQLHLSPHTIGTHRKNIMRKLGVNTVSEITMYAVRLGLVC